MEDEDLGKLFREKNKEIFINSLILEMERNLDALKSTTDNCVALEINKLGIFLKNFFKENDIDFKKEELLGMLFREKTEINKIVNTDLNLLQKFSIFFSSDSMKGYNKLKNNIYSSFSSLISLFSLVSLLINIFN